MSDDLAWLAADVRSDFDAEEPTRPKTPTIVVPTATLRAPWWRRWIAWLTGSDITTYCARCHARLDVHSDGVCFWCKSLAASLDGWRPPYAAEPEMSVSEASELLTDLRRKINDARIRP